MRGIVNIKYEGEGSWFSFWDVKRVNQSSLHLLFELLIVFVL